MDTMDRLVAESTEFVCEQWGEGEAAVTWFAPVTRQGGRVWLHPTFARNASFEEICRKATRVWKVTGSFWNPSQFQLVFRANRENQTVSAPGYDG